MDFITTESPSELWDSEMLFPVFQAMIQEAIDFPPGRETGGGGVQGYKTRSDRQE